MASVTLTFYSRIHKVYRDPDGHVLLVLEITTDRGKLISLNVIDPRDYEDDDA